MNKIIALTMGDPMGIGPEIAVRACCDPEVNACCRPVIVGDRQVLLRAARVCGLGENEIERLEIDDVPMELPPEFPGDAGEYAFEHRGTVNKFGGLAAFRTIERAHRRCVEGAAAAVATGPINKVSLRMAAVPFIGHTEIFGALCGADDPLTMFETLGLRVFFLTRHVSLREACDLVTAERVYDYIVRSTSALSRLGAAPSAACPLAVAGLNPHSGEHGLFGTEELTAVVPAVDRARAEGLHVVGPVSADSVFHLAKIGRFAAVLSLYHDQGHIATKTLDFERTISITHGLPYLRASVDHGTAFDIAWSGEASAVSMIEAVKLAAKYAESGKPLG